MTAAAIFSLSGSVLTTEEAALFAETMPAGYILFRRNIETPDQLRGLTDALHDLHGERVPVLIDQEGGRVCRLQPPHWPRYPAARNFGALYERDPVAAGDALRNHIAALCADLTEAGLSVDCAPVMDLLLPETHDAIGDRAYAGDPAVVTAVALEACRAFLRAGIVPVTKHWPGHGRAVVDPHIDLPVVGTPRATLEQTDFIPFRRLSDSDLAPLVWGMVAHVIYTDIDPHRPASLSDTVIKGLIREDMGFDGLLLSDDIGMGALSAFGTAADRALACLRAGCDIALHCNGDFEEMKAIASVIPDLSDARLALLKAAMGLRHVA